MSDSRIKLTKELEENFFSESAFVKAMKNIKYKAKACPFPYIEWPKPKEAPMGALETYKAYRDRLNQMRTEGNGKLSVRIVVANADPTKTAHEMLINYSPFDSAFSKTILEALGLHIRELRNKAAEEARAVLDEIEDEEAA